MAGTVQKRERFREVGRGKKKTKDKRRKIELDREQRVLEGERGATRAILRHREIAASISTVKSWIFY